MGQFDFGGACPACGAEFHALVVAPEAVCHGGRWCIVCGAALPTTEPGIERCDLSEGDRRTSDRIIAEALGWSL